MFVRRSEDDGRSIQQNRTFVYAAQGIAEIPHVKNLLARERSYKRMEAVAVEDLTGRLPGHFPEGKIQADQWTTGYSERDLFGLLAVKLPKPQGNLTFVRPKPKREA